MDNKTSSDGNLVYEEMITSKKTQGLFVTLMILFALLAAWRTIANSFNALAVIFLCLSLVFLFYVLNYRTLVIRLTKKALKLKFGVISWTVPAENIESCSLDDLPKFMAMGGAGVHFMSVRGRYRASFNFLEYPRVVIVFKKNKGPVVDLSFTTQQPEKVTCMIESMIGVNGDWNCLSDSN